MKLGTVVALRGVHHRERVTGDDGYETLEDVVSEKGAVFVKTEPSPMFDQPDRLVLRLFNRSIVSADAADVTEVGPPTDKSIAFAEEVA